MEEVRLSRMVAPCLRQDENYIYILYGGEQVLRGLGNYVAVVADTWSSSGSSNGNIDSTNTRTTYDELISTSTYSTYIII